MVEKPLPTTPAAPSSRRPLHLKLSAYVSLSQPETEFLDAFARRAEELRQREDVVKQGERFGKAYVMLDGWAIRHRTLPDGRRQVINFVLPGDFVGLYANLFQVADHTVTTLTPATVAAVELDAIVDMFRGFPKIAAAVAWSGAREESMIAERLLSLGRRTAFERMAHLLVELLRRLRSIGQAVDQQFILPVTQEILADALGLSLVHVNRTLRRLRESGLIELDGQKVVVRDVGRLAAAGQFDELYLQLAPAPKRLQRRLVEARASKSA
jgi:CRP-like cAMP-binding protein